MLDISGSSEVNLPGRREPLAIFTSFVFTEAKGYLVAWAFMSGTQSGLQELKNTKLLFALPSPEPAGRPQQ
jgi:hypothetical protein